MAYTLNGLTYDYSGFSPQSISTWVERSLGVPAGFSILTNRVDGGGEAATKVRWKLKVPVIAAVDSVQAVAGEMLREYFVDIVFTVPAGATLAERTSVEDRINDLVALAPFKASITSLIQPSS